MTRSDKIKKLSTLLIWHFGALGDTLFTYPLIYHVKTNYPHIKIVTIGSNSWSIFKSMDWIDHFFPSHHAWVSSWFGNKKPTMPEPLLETLKAPIAIWAFFSSPESTLMNNMLSLGAKTIEYCPVKPNRDKPHEFYAKRLLGINNIKVPLLTINKVYFLSQRNKTKKINSILIHPGSGSLAKNIPYDWLRLLIYELESLNIEPVLIMGPTEEENKTVMSFKYLDVSIKCSQSLDELVNIISSFTIFLGADSGPTHLASLLGLYTMSIFGPTNPKMFSPIGPLGVCYYKPLACSPCYSCVPLKNCSGEKPCLRFLKPTMLAKEIAQTLELFAKN